MVDRNHLKIADQAPVADEDPFAELTRIMGFDPRQPVKQANAPDDTSSHDDFSIDLEKELMGEFEAEEADDGRGQDAQFDAPEAAGAEAAYDDEIEFDLAEDFHEELAAAAEEVQPEAAVSDDNSYETGIDLDLGDHFDDALVASVGKEMALGHDWSQATSGGDPEQAVAADLDEPVVFDAMAEDQLAADFDSSHADVDMDFRMDPETAEMPDATLEDEAPDYAAPSVEAEAPEDHHEMVALDEDDLNLDEDHLALDEDERVQQADAVHADAGLDAAVEEDPLLTVLSPIPSLKAEIQPSDAVASESEPQADERPFEASDVSLEDELNALLGNTTNDAAAAEQHVEPAAAAVQELDWNLDDEESPAETAVEYGQEIEGDAPAVVSHAVAHDDMHDLDLSSLDFAEVDDRREFSATDHQVAAQDDEAASVGDDDLPDFDHDAFDAAIANGIQSSASHHDYSDRYDVDYHAGEPEQSPAAPAVEHKEDPLDVIAALTAKYSTPLPSTYSRSNQVAQPAPEPEPAPRQEAYEGGEEDHAEIEATAFDGAPEIETIEVHDKAVALADDLDIPELAYEEDLPPVSAYDDLDSEFANLLHDMNAGEPAPQRAAAEAYDDDFAPAGRDDASEDHAPYPDYAPQVAATAAAAAAAAAATAFQAPAATHAAYDDELDRAGYAYDDPHDSKATQGTTGYEAGDYGYDPDLDDEAMSAPMAAAEERTQPQRRGMLIAAIVGGVAIAGGLGAFVLSFGGGGDEVPALVRADDGPIKVKPENPGGTTVPNQDNKVYETVAGKDASSDPQQEKLVTTAEEPVDMTPPAPEPRLADVAPAEEEAAPTAAPTASPKGEDRIEQILAEADADVDTKVAAIAPRKVRTMVVRPDGTLVPREDPAPVETAAPAPQAAAPAAETATAPAASTSGTSMPDTTATVPEATVSTPSLTPPAGETAATPETPAVAAPQAQPAQTMPNSVPLAPQRPAEQPVDVVGEVKPDKVAAVSPSQPATSAGAWSMQIASQPSEAAAKSSYQDLVRRYGSVLNGHEANIVKADIAGKGTFWRVRIPAQSRNDAISLCESYKAAGGNCFVSR